MGERPESGGGKTWACLITILVPGTVNLPGKWTGENGEEKEVESIIDRGDSAQFRVLGGRWLCKKPGRKSTIL